MKQDPDTPEKPHDETRVVSKPPSRPPSQPKGNGKTVLYIVMTFVIIALGGVLIAALRRSAGG